jgi:hypothetical protein
LAGTLRRERRTVLPFHAIHPLSEVYPVQSSPKLFSFLGTDRAFLRHIGRQRSAALLATVDHNLSFPSQPLEGIPGRAMQQPDVRE